MSRYLQCKFAGGKYLTHIIDWKVTLIPSYFSYGMSLVFPRSILFQVYGLNLRKHGTEASITYIQENPPEKYREALVPHTLLGCKIRVMDTDYLECFLQKLT